MLFVPHSIEAHFISLDAGGLAEVFPKEKPLASCWSALFGSAAVLSAKTDSNKYSHAFLFKAHRLIGDSLDVGECTWSVYNETKTSNIKTYENT